MDAVGFRDSGYLTLTSNTMCPILIARPSLENKAETYSKPTFQVCLKYLAKMMALPAKPSQATSMKSPCSFSSRFDPAPTRTTSFRLSGSDVKLRSYKKKIKYRD